MEQNVFNEINKILENCKKQLIKYINLIVKEKNRINIKGFTLDKEDDEDNPNYFLYNTIAWNDDWKQAVLYESQDDYEDITLDELSINELENLIFHIKVSMID